MHNWSTSDAWEDLDGKKSSGPVRLAKTSIQVSLCHDGWCQRRLIECDINTVWMCLIFNSTAQLTCIIQLNVPYVMPLGSKLERSGFRELWGMTAAWLDHSASRHCCVQQEQRASEAPGMRVGWLQCDASRKQQIRASAWHTRWFQFAHSCL